MIGAALVVVLVTMVVPITLLLMAVVVDLVVVAWAIFRLWHDDWSPRLGRFVMGMVHKGHVPLRHRPAH